MRERQVSPVEVTEAALRRIEAADGELGAFVEVDGDARAGAGARDRRRRPARVRRRPDRDQGQHDGRPGWTMDYGSAAAGRPPRRPRRAPRAPAARRGLRRSSGSPRCRSSGSCRPPSRARRPGPQPVGPGPHAGRLERRRRGGGRVRACCRSPTATTAAARSASPPRAAGSSASSRAAGASRAGRTPATRCWSATASLSRTVLDTAAALDVLAGYEVGDATWAPPPDVAFTTRRQPRAGRAARPRRHRQPARRARCDPEQRRRRRRDRRARSSRPRPRGRGRRAGPSRRRRRCRCSSTVFAANIALGAAHAQVLAGREAGRTTSSRCRGR